MWAEQYFPFTLEVAELAGDAQQLWTLRERALICLGRRHLVMSQTTRTREEDAVGVYYFKRSCRVGGERRRGRGALTDVNTSYFFDINTWSTNLTLDLLHITDWQKRAASSYDTTDIPASSRHVLTLLPASHLLVWNGNKMLFFVFCIKTGSGLRVRSRNQMTRTLTVTRGLNFSPQPLPSHRQQISLFTAETPAATLNPPKPGNECAGLQFLVFTEDSDWRSVLHYNKPPPFPPSTLLRHRRLPNKREEPSYLSSGGIQSSWTSQQLVSGSL